VTTWPRRATAPSPIATSSSRPLDSRVESWLEALLAAPGLTAIEDPEEARRVHVENALAALDLLGEGPVVDVGSGGGSPGLPLAAERPDLRFDLLESQRRKCAFLEAWAGAFPNVSVVCVRAEDHGRGAGREAYGTALARALAPPAVAAEWCLPLLRDGGVAVLFVGPSADPAPVAKAATFLATELEPAPPGFLLLRKAGPTPARFPRRPGTARKRPLA
jgi:16S rRNA (guanine527-N7)-methyltransferase